MSKSYRHTARVRYVLKDYRAKAPSTISMTMQVDRKRLKWSIGEKVDPRDWNTDTRRPIIGSRTQAKKYDLQLLSEKLDTYAQAALDLYRDWKLDTATGIATYNPAKFKQELEYRTGRLERPGAAVEKLDVSDFVRFAESIRDLRKDSTGIVRGTWKVINNHTNLLREFADLRHGGTVGFAEVDELFVDGFKKWLYRTKDHNRRTVHKVMMNLRSIASRADDRELMTYGNRFKAWTKIKFRKMPQVGLSRAELDKFRTVDLTTVPRLERVRDLFLIGVVTAQRFSDYSKLDRGSFKALPAGGYRYQIVSQRKTGAPAAGVVMSWAVPVLEKYGYVGGAEFNPPYLSQQKFNDYLKEVAQLAIPDATHTEYHDGELLDNDGTVIPKWSKMGSHVARRTAVGLLRSLQLPDHEIQKMTGHKKLAEMDGYDVRETEELALEQRDRLDTAFAKSQLRAV
jgi:hypothetical protein